MMIAMLGTGLALGIIAGIYYSLPREVVLAVSTARGLDFLPLPVVGYMVLAGAVLGLVGAMVSVNKFLE